METVYNYNKTLLQSKYGFNPDWERIRPEPNQLDRLTEDCSYFWDGLLRFEPIELVASRQRGCPEFRPQDLHQRGEGHLLFRPIGQETLAEAVATIMEEEESGFDGIDQICQRCVGVDWKLASPPWAGLFFGEGGRIEHQHQEAAERGFQVTTLYAGDTLAGSVSTAPRISGGSLPQRPGLAGSDETGIASQNQLRYSTGHNLTTFPPHKD